MSWWKQLFKVKLVYPRHKPEGLHRPKTLPIPPSTVWKPTAPKNLKLPNPVPVPAPPESPRKKWDSANQLGMFLHQHINVLRLVETGQITVVRAIEALCIFRAGNTPELPELEYRKLDRDWL